MNQEEMQIIRKFRQVPDEVKAQIVGYVDYEWASKRMTMNESAGKKKKQ